MAVLYRPTREDVLAAVQPRGPNPRSGPDNPDPFGVNEVAWGELWVAYAIAERRQLPLPRGHVGRAVDRAVLRELLAEMVADGSIVGRSVKEWAELGRDHGRSKELRYTSVETAARWAREDAARSAEE